MTMTNQNAFNMKSLNDVVEYLHKIFDKDHINVETVMDLFASYKSNPEDWRKFAKFDAHRYTRNLVDQGNGKFNLMILCWGEGMGSSIHDHAGAHCFVKVLDGALTETMFDWPKDDEDGPVHEKGSNTYPTDSVSYINDTIGLHRVENKSHTDPAVSLHLYIPPFDSCHTFDQRTGHSHVARVTFWSKFGEKVNQQNPCVAIDPIDNTEQEASSSGNQKVVSPQTSAI